MAVKESFYSPIAVKKSFHSPYGGHKAALDPAVPGAHRLLGSGDGRFLGASWWVGPHMRLGLVLHACDYRRVNGRTV